MEAYSGRQPDPKRPDVAAAVDNPLEACIRIATQGLTEEQLNRMTPQEVVANYFRNKGSSPSLATHVARPNESQIAPNLRDQLANLRRSMGDLALGIFAQLFRPFR